MKLFKSIGLVLGLALFATAFLAVGSASAVTTKLCRANEAKCSKANTWSVGTESLVGAIGPASEEAKLVMPGLLTVSCTSGKLGASLKETAGALVGELVKWNQSSCIPTADSCTLRPPKEFETGYSAEVEATGEGNGVLTVGLNPSLTVICVGALKILCNYTTPTMKFAIKGGSGGGGKNPQISSEAPMTRAGKNSESCPSTATYVSLYQVTVPGSPMFVTN